MAVGDDDETAHCMDVAEKEIGPHGVSPFNYRKLCDLLLRERDAAWAEGRVDGRREAEEDHADYVKERAELVRVLGVEGDQTLVDAGRWFMDTDEMPALREVEREVRLFLKGDPEDAEDWDQRAFEALARLDGIRKVGKR